MTSLYRCSSNHKPSSGNDGCQPAIGVMAGPHSQWGLHDMIVAAAGDSIYGGILIPEHEAPGVLGRFTCGPVSRPHAGPAVDARIAETDLRILHRIAALRRLREMAPRAGLRQGSPPRVRAPHRGTSERSPDAVKLARRPLGVKDSALHLGLPDQRRPPSRSCQLPDVRRRAHDRARSEPARVGLILPN